MAEEVTEVQQQIDRLLDYLTDAWQGLPRAELEIDGWDLIEQIDYPEEWTPKDDLAEQLRRELDSTDATLQQRARYQQLEQLMDRYRPILTRLRAS